MRLISAMYLGFRVTVYVQWIGFGQNKYMIIGQTLPAVEITMTLVLRYMHLHMKVSRLWYRNTYRDNNNNKQVYSQLHRVGFKYRRKLADATRSKNHLVSNKFNTISCYNFYMLYSTYNLQAIHGNKMRRNAKNISRFFGNKIRT